MGNQAIYGKNAAKADFFGNVYLDLETDTFIPGENVQGTVFVNIKNPYPGDKLSLKIKGKEHTRWIDKVSRQKQRADGTFEHWTERVVREQELTVIKQEILVYDWANRTILNPGQFSFPISFRIPEGLAGSFFFGAGETTAEICYKIEAFIDPEGKQAPKIKHKRPLIIREPVKNSIQTREVYINKNIKTGCCCCTSDKGPLNVKTMFEKDAYTPLEVARVISEIDSSKCEANIQDVSFSFTQSLALTANGHNKGFHFTVAKTSLGSITAGQSFVGPNRKEASIQLPPMQMGSYKDMKNGSVQHFSYDQNAAITPSANGRIIKSNYTLSVLCSMEGCLCCDTNPSTSLPVQIYALVQKPMVRPPPPANWQPQVMPPVILNVNINGNAGPQNISINMNNGGMPNQQQNMNISIQQPLMPQQQGGFPQQQGGYPQQQGGFPQQGEYPQQQGGYPQQQGGYPQQQGGFPQQGGYPQQQGGYPQQQGGYPQQGGYNQY